MNNGTQKETIHQLNPNNPEDAKAIKVLDKLEKEVKEGKRKTISEKEFLEKHGKQPPTPHDDEDEFEKQFAKTLKLDKKESEYTRGYVVATEHILESYGKWWKPLQKAKLAKIQSEAERKFKCLKDYDGAEYRNKADFAVCNECWERWKKNWQEKAKDEALKDVKAYIDKRREEFYSYLDEDGEFRAETFSPKKKYGSLEDFTVSIFDNFDETFSKSFKQELNRRKEKTKKEVKQ